MKHNNPNKNFDPVKDVPDLAGKVIIVTGSNTGVGYGTVKHLARRGAKVYMAARTESKAMAAIEKMKGEGLEPGNGEVIWLKLDLSDPRDVKASAEEFLKKETRLDVLVNNAAQLLDKSYEKTRDDLVDTIMINHIGPFVFTRTLLPLLTATSKEPDSDARIVVLASEGHRMVPPYAKYNTTEDLNNEFKKARVPSFTRYTYSKMCNVLWAQGLQNRLTADNVDISVLIVDPGWVNSFWTVDRLPFLKSTPKFFVNGAEKIINIWFQTPDKGAYNSVFAAASPQVRAEPEKFKGVYLQETGFPQPVSEDAAKPENIKALWEWTEGFLKGIDV